MRCQRVVLVVERDTEWNRCPFLVAGVECRFGLNLKPECFPWAFGGDRRNRIGICPWTLLQFDAAFVVDGKSIRFAVVERPRTLRCTERIDTIEGVRARSGNL